MIRPNRSSGLEKQLLSIFRRCLYSMQVKTQIISQDPATLEKAARIAMSETSILSHVRCESSHEAMEVDPHGQRINIQAVRRNRDQGVGERIVGLVKYHRKEVVRKINRLIE